MGYVTDYCGIIRLSDKKIERKLRNLFQTDEELQEHFDVEGIALGDMEIEISGYGKMYDEKLEKFCLFIAKIDKKSYGEIECSGEETDDLWRINISEGVVLIKNGNVIYEEDGSDYKDSSINKDVYKITEDKTLLREIMVDELEK